MKRSRELVSIALVVIVLAIMIWFASARAEGGYSFVGIIGLEILADGRFNNPQTVAVDSSGNIFSQR